MTGPISDEEFAARRTAVLAAAEARGLDGLLVCGRGGGTLDRYANVFYLTNFYSAFPYIPDHPGHWRGRAHSYLVLPRRGPARPQTALIASARSSSPLYSARPTIAPSTPASASWRTSSTLLTPPAASTLTR